MNTHRECILNDVATSNRIWIRMPKTSNCFITYLKYFAVDNFNYFDMTQ